ncbi:MAG: class I SAM-dependent methyltransferase [bacterium]|nr:class I SAM-dependent methyltransferase [bacterium]
MSRLYTEIDWYDTPLYYDIIFDADTGIEADFLEAACELYGPKPSGKSKSTSKSKPTPRRVLEPACGSGRLVLEMAARGWQVTGIDLSEAMLEYARGRLKKPAAATSHQRGETAARKPRVSSATLQKRVTLKQADMADFRVAGSFDLAHCLVSSFKYLASESAARSHLQSVARALKADGIYVLGLHLSEYEDRRTSRERWVGERDGVHVTCVIEGWPPEVRKRQERVRSRLTVREGDGSAAKILRNETNWSFRTYDDRQLQRLIRSVPELELVAVHDFSYRLDRLHTLDDEQLDTLLILRRR